MLPPEPIMLELIPPDRAADEPPPPPRLQAMAAPANPAIRLTANAHANVLIPMLRMATLSSTLSASCNQTEPKEKQGSAVAAPERLAIRPYD